MNSSLARGTQSTARTKSVATVSAEELFRRYSPAVVKIEIKQQGIPISIGAGFFVSADGALVTNHHVMRAAIASKDVTAEFTLNDRKVIRDFKVASCGDARNIDLCLLKLDVKPKTHFTLPDHRPAPGEGVYVIGHPQGLDFSISNGIVSALRTSTMGIDEVQISAAISPGNSGGPIFNDRAQLIGVATKYLATGQNLNFGILSSEIRKYRRTHRRFVGKAEANQKMMALTRAEMRKRFTSEIEPAIQLALKHKGSAELSGTKEIPFDLGNETIRLRIPKIFESCAKAPGASGTDAVIHACFAYGESVAFSIQRYQLEGKGSLLKKSGTHLLPPKALAIVESLQQEGTWTEKAKGLTNAQKASFESKPSTARCQKLPALRSAGTLFSQAPICRFSVANDQEPGGYSVNLWIEQDRDLYAFAIWMNDSALAEYFSQVPLLAALTARRNSQENAIARASRISDP